MSAPPPFPNSHFPPPMRPAVGGAPPFPGAPPPPPSAPLQPSSSTAKRPSAPPAPSSGTSAVAAAAFPPPTAAFAPPQAPTSSSSSSLPAAARLSPAPAPGAGAAAFPPPPQPHHQPAVGPTRTAAAAAPAPSAAAYGRGGFPAPPMPPSSSSSAPSLPPPPVAPGSNNMIYKKAPVAPPASSSLPPPPIAPPTSSISHHHHHHQHHHHQHHQHHHHHPPTQPQPQYAHTHSYQQQGTMMTNSNYNNSGGVVSSSSPGVGVGGPPSQQPPQQQHQQNLQHQQHQQHSSSNSSTNNMMMRSASSTVEENVSTHTMVLERASTRSSKVLRHASVVRSTNQDVRLVANQHTNFGTPAKPVDTECIQVTTTVMPNSTAVAEKYALPIGVSVRPLAPCYAAKPPPVVHFQEIDPSIQMVRCSQCRSYINPFAVFTAPDRYQCSICRRSNPVPVAYQCQIDRATGRRTDIQQRSELLHSTCEIVAPQDYVQSAPKRPTMLFLIDVSYHAVSSGMLAHVCQGIADGISGGALTEDYQIAFVAFDSNVYLFHLGAELESPKMVVAPDVVGDALEFNDKGEIQRPLELPSLLDELFCCPKDSQALILTLMSKLPTMFAHSNASETALGPALNVAMSLLAGPGGKVFAFIGSRPAAGEGKLEPRPTSANSGDTQGVQPASDFYKVRAIACSAHQVSVDLYTSAVVDVDLATIAPIARYTSGHITRVSQHTLPGLPRDIERAMSREYAFDAVLRIRTPSNVTLKNFFGHFYVRGPDLLALPVCDSDSVYSFEVAPTTNLSQNGAPVFIQLALMYTNKNRDRLIRVSTFGFETSGDLNRIYNRISSPVTASFLAKMLIDQCISNTFQKAIQYVLDRLALSLKTFRTLLGQQQRSTSANQLTLPSSLASLPLFLAGMFRTPAVRPALTTGGGSGAGAAGVDTNSVRADERVASGAVLVFSTIEAFLSVVMPCCFCIWDPASSADELPRAELCSAESFNPSCMYFIDIGSHAFCWIGQSVPEAVVSAFGFVRDAQFQQQQYANNDHHSNSDIRRDQLEPLCSAATAAASELFKNRQGLYETTKTWGNIIVVSQNGTRRFETTTRSAVFHNVLASNGLEKSLQPYLVEDELHESMSYGALLLNLQKRSLEP